LRRNEAVLVGPARREIQNDPFGEGWLLLVASPVRRPSSTI